MKKSTYAILIIIVIFALTACSNDVELTGEVASYLISMEDIKEDIDKEWKRVPNKFNNDYFYSYKRNHNGLYIMYGEQYESNKNQKGNFKVTICDLSTSEKSNKLFNGFIFKPSKEIRDKFVDEINQYFMVDDGFVIQEDNNLSIYILKETLVYSIEIEGIPVDYKVVLKNMVFCISNFFDTKAPETK